MRGPVILIVILVLLIAGVVLLSRSANEVAVTTIETDVAGNGAAN